MRRLLLIAILIASGLLGVPQLAHADVNDFTITDFSSDQTLTNADRQGELHIVEHITVDFTDQNHGIIRTIPQSYHKHTLRFHLNSVSSTTGAPTEVSTTTQNGNTVLRIGDPDKTVTGMQEYTIDYNVDNVITFYNNHDELYWDINGDQWNQPFQKVSATVHLPDGLNLSQPVRCLTGAYGSTDATCTVSRNGNDLSVSANSLAAKQTLTYVAGFDKGYFQPMTALERFEEYAGPALEFAVPVIVALLVGFIWWLRSGRDAKGKGTIVPEYAPPQGISPLDAGTIADFKVDNRDLTATFIDLARRGYLRIVEQRQDRLLGKDKLSYTMELRNADWSGCNSAERQLLNGVFTGAVVGRVASLDDLKNKLYKTATSLRKSVSADLTARGYFKQDPYRFAKYSSLSFSGVFILLYVFGEIASHAGSFLPFLFGVVVGGIVLALFAHVMPARSASGVVVNDQLRGLKLYMNTAEKDRLEKLEGPNAAYAAGAGQPVRTVELFEKLLPYAIVLQVEKQWAGQFKDIYTSPPDWYSGNWTTFNIGYLAGSLNDGFNSAVNNSFSSPSSSGSSGFGGGGFAGGGGGGGGGGGW